MEIYDQLQKLTARIEAIERRIGITPIAPTPAPSPQPASTRLVSQEIPQPTVRTESPLSSARLLGVVAVICVVLAAAFVVRLAFDSGWLTPVRQIGLAMTLGAVLIAAGLFLKDQDKRYSSYLPASGIVVLFLSVIGAHLFHHLLGGAAALAGMGMISLLSIWLFTIWRYDLYPILAAVGSYLTPFLLDLSWSDFTTIAIYSLGWSILYVILSVYIRSRSLAIVSSYFGVGLLGHLATAGQFLDHGNGTVAIVQAVQFLLFAGGILAYSMVHKEPLGSRGATFLYPLTILFYISEYSLLLSVYNELAPWVMVGISAALLALQAVGKKALKDTSASWSLVESFGAVTFLHSVFFELLTDISRPMVLIGLLVGSLLSGHSARNAYRSLTTGIVLLVITVVGYGSVGYYVVGLEPGAPLMIWQIYGVILAALFLLNGYRNSLAGGSSQSVYFLLGHSLTVATLYGICEPYGSIALSVAWSVYAVTVLVIGFSAHNAALAKSSMVVLFFSVAKVFLYDVSNAAPLVRILCLLVTAGVLYGTGWVFRTIEGWKRS